MDNKSYINVIVTVILLVIVVIVGLIVFTKKNPMVDEPNTPIASEPLPINNTRDNSPWKE